MVVKNLERLMRDQHYEQDADFGDWLSDQDFEPEYEDLSMQYHKECFE